MWKWDNATYAHHLRRIRETMQFIPPNVETVLDVGCGNGIFVNNLPRGRFKRIVGLDKSPIALKWVKKEKVCGDISSIPFKDRSFDLVCCLEVLEHLLQEIYPKVLMEICRVSKRYILITVPNQENLVQGFIRCPSCKCFFHTSLHIRSFNKVSLQSLFPLASVIQISEIGPIKKIRDGFLYNTVKVIFLLYRKSLPSSRTVCPQCGAELLPGKIKNLNNGNRVIRMIANQIREFGFLIRTKRKGTWLLALYAKR